LAFLRSAIGSGPAGLRLTNPFAPVSYVRMTMGRVKRRPDATRKRILENAGRLFARHGFDGVGFRDIAARAQVSLRMPNHHFGSKSELFGACIRYALLEKLDFPGLFSDPPVFANAAAAKAAVAAKIRACFTATHPLSGRNVWYSEILSRAMVEDRPESLAALQEGLGYSRVWFFEALRVIQPDLTPGRYLFWYVSLWAQISFYSSARTPILRRADRHRYDRAFLSSAADHLVHVMLAQLQPPAAVSGGRSGGRK